MVISIDYSSKLKGKVIKQPLTYRKINEMKPEEL
jgi:hypothetical protein